MDETKVLTANRTLSEEHHALQSLILDCEELLQKWKAYDYTTETEPADAIVALLTLQYDARVRIVALEYKLSQPQLPF